MEVLLPKHWTKEGWVLECGHLILWFEKLISACVPHLSYRSQCFWHLQNMQKKKKTLSQNTAFSKVFIEGDVLFINLGSEILSMFSYRLNAKPSHCLICTIMGHRSLGKWRENIVDILQIIRSSCEKKNHQLWWTLCNKMSLKLLAS